MGLNLLLEMDFEIKYNLIVDGILGFVCIRKKYY